MIDIISEISRLCDKYGEEFNWGIVPQENGFVRELSKETNVSQYEEVRAVARSYACDEVLFLFDNNIYRIYHADIGTISSCLAVDDAMGNLGLLRRWGVVFKVSRIKSMKYILYSRFSH